MSDKRQAILVTVPNQHWIHSSVVRVMMLLLKDGRCGAVIQSPAHKPYVNNLHHCVNEFMSGQYDYWLNIDADNPPVSNPLDLVQLDKDIIGLPTPVWHFEGKEGERPVCYNGYDYDSAVDAYREHTPQEGLQLVDAVGTGCILIARRVFEHHDLRHGAFFRTWNADGTMDKGNDIAFCERARRAEFDIYCHYDYPCDHFSELSLRESIRAMMAMGVG